jgi:hypothetical protein
MEQEQTRLHRDRDPNFIRNLETAAAFEAFLSEKNLNMAEKLGLIGGRQPVEKGNIPLDRAEQILWKRLSTQLTPPALLEESKNHIGGITSANRGDAQFDLAFDCGSI